MKDDSTQDILNRLQQVINELDRLVFDRRRLDGSSEWNLDAVKAVNTLQRIRADIFDERIARAMDRAIDAPVSDAVEHGRLRKTDALLGAPVNGAASLSHKVS